ncbi:hypothetical protein LY90DRAFT_506673 [Neocallimastix californiae]|uniref:Beta-ketoacyl synthase-like N-terminal domain-containing protein n=1 Tax=Neocallimastix californiae TaxID=1754190 RepID=A0A1Y2DDI5_9FUNG|nr:hypothetical protein LY90DRAFT_506673 [Neocallimastix californiae]|eukprot:ORY56755.1 hypothetical protein LY90DRAFT_506673 [Neocallimastix californiae]
MNEKVAIIGMALRLPGSIINTKSFWMTLVKGRDCVLPPVKDRNLNICYTNKSSGLLDPHEHNISCFGCYDNRGGVSKPSEFDAEFFNCLPEEALSLDPRTSLGIGNKLGSFRKFGYSSKYLRKY